MIVGVVGIKNSGKTFFSQKLIEYYTSIKLKVASIKHAHHDFDIDKPGTDSFLHRKSGSTEIIVSSSKRWAKIVELQNKDEKNLNELIKELDNPDIVIVEGFKNESHPKIVIIKDGSKDLLFKKLINVKAIVSDEYIDTKIPQFKKNDIEKIAKFLINK